MMHIDIDLHCQKLEGLIHDLTTGISRVYKGITRHYGWPFELPSSSNFILSRRRPARPEEKGPVAPGAMGDTDRNRVADGIPAESDNHGPHDQKTVLLD
jgi:hypothetical protein